MSPPEDTSKIVLYVDDRNEFGQQALKWFEGVPNVCRIPVSGGLPRAVHGPSTYLWEFDELRNFAEKCQRRARYERYRSVSE